MSLVQWIVRGFGWGFVIVALLGFSASGVGMDADMETAPRVLGLFPVNLVHNLIHLGFGLWAMVAYHWLRQARSYAVITGSLYLLLAVLGAVAPELFGLAPIGGNDVWLHLGIGLILVPAGIAGRGPSAAIAEPRVQTGTGHRHRTSLTASSPEATVTRPPAQPSGTREHAAPVDPETAGSEGAAPAAPPPSPPGQVVDEPPRQPEGPTPPPEPDERGR